MKDQKERKGGEKGRKGREGPSIGGGSFMEKIHNRRSVCGVSRKDDKSGHRVKEEETVVHCAKGC